MENLCRSDYFTTAITHEVGTSPGVKLSEEMRNCHRKHVVALTTRIVTRVAGIEEDIIWTWQILDRRNPSLSTGPPKTCMTWSRTWREWVNGARSARRAGGMLGTLRPSVLGFPGATRRPIGRGRRDLRLLWPTEVESSPSSLEARGCGGATPSARSTVGPRSPSRGSSFPAARRCSKSGMARTLRRRLPSVPRPPVLAYPPRSPR
jgi:hypothetical protein